MEKFYAAIRFDGEVTSLLNYHRYMYLVRRPNFWESLILPSTVSAGWFTANQIEQQRDMARQFNAADLDNHQAWYNIAKTLHAGMTEQQIRQHIMVAKHIEAREAGEFGKALPQRKINDILFRRR